jgi:hypothetical protein
VSAAKVRSRFCFRRSILFFPLQENRANFFISSLFNLLRQARKTQYPKTSQTRIYLIPIPL